MSDDDSNRETSRESYASSVAEMERGWQSSKNLGQCFGHLFRSGLWADVTFLCRDQNSVDMTLIKAHKLVLAARSPVFQAMLFGPFGERQSEIEIKEIDVTVFLAFLRFLYTDVTGFTPENVADVLALAHRYQVDSLVSASEEFLATCVSSQNACELLQMAFVYGLENLKFSVSQYIDEHANEVLDSVSFLNCPIDCLTYILQGNTFNAKEKKIFEKSMEWGRRRCLENNTEPDGKAIKAALGNAFFYIRIPSMQFHEFLSCSKGKGYFSLEEQETLLDQIAGNAQTTMSCPVPRSLRKERLWFKSSPVNLAPINFCVDISVDRGTYLTFITTVTSSVDVGLDCLYLTQIQLATPVGKTIYLMDETKKRESEAARSNWGRPFNTDRYYLTTLVPTKGEYEVHEAIPVNYVYTSDILFNIIPKLKGAIKCDGHYSDVCFKACRNSAAIECTPVKPLLIGKGKTHNIEVCLIITDDRLRLAAHRTLELQKVSSCCGTVEACVRKDVPDIVREIVWTRASGRRTNNSTD